MIAITVGRLQLGFPSGTISELKARAVELRSTCQDPDVCQAYRAIWKALDDERKARYKAGC